MLEEKSERLQEIRNEELLSFREMKEEMEKQLLVVQQELLKHKEEELRRSSVNSQTVQFCAEVSEISGLNEEISEEEEEEKCQTKNIAQNEKSTSLTGRFELTEDHFKRLLSKLEGAKNRSVEVTAALEVIGTLKAHLLEL